MKVIRVLFVTFFLIHIQMSGQDIVKEANVLYNTAIENYNKQAYKEAERFFTKSLALVGDRDTYFGRGLCYGKMADQKAFCSDMANAALAGHERAKMLFTKGCGSIDTAYVPFKFQGGPALISKVFSFRCSDTTYVFTKRYHSQALTPAYDSIVHVNEAETDTAGPLVPPDYPGGINAFRMYLANTIVYPKKPIENGISGKVYLSFTIYEDGTIHDINVDKGITGYPEMEIEAMRVVAMSKRWYPSKKGKKLIRSVYNLPVSFNIQY